MAVGSRRGATVGKLACVAGSTDSAAKRYCPFVLSLSPDEYLKKKKNINVNVKNMQNKCVQKDMNSINSTFYETHVGYKISINLFSSNILFGLERNLRIEHMHNRKDQVQELPSNATLF
jgi:hypothetical protein